MSSERIIKLQSEQNFSETALPNAFIGKLLDFTIPGNVGMSYDLAKSYVNINMELFNANANDSEGDVPDGAVYGDDTALYSNEIQLADAAPGTAGVKEYLAPCSQMVRNADMFSQNAGMVSSIRRVNTLRSILWNLENDRAEQHDGLDKFGTFEGRRGLKNRTTSLIQNVGFNRNPTSGVSDDTIVSQGIARDFRIPLSDIYPDVGNRKWNGDRYGDTRLHLEIQPNNLTIAQLGGQEATETFTGQGQNATYGKMVDYDAAGLGQLAAAASLGLGSLPLITVLKYNEPGLYCPFHVGGAIKVTASASGATTSITNKLVIASMEVVNAARKVSLEAAGLTNVPIGAIAIYTRTAFIVNAGGANDITNISMENLLSAASSIQINRAELVLSEMEEAAMEIGPYTSYTTEETQGHAGLARLNKQVIIDPLCDNLIVANCASNVITPDRKWASYRIAIDNVDQSGNRDIRFNESIHVDRMMRFFANRNQEWTNSSLRAIDSTLPQKLGGSSPADPDGNNVLIYPILETMPSIPQQQIVNLELDGGAVEPQDLIFFKEVNREI